MTHTVFFSWQSDTSPTEGRNLINNALNRAVQSVSTDTTVEDAIRELTVDKDTQGVPGYPPIVDTIFEKIDTAAIFVADLTFVGRRSDGRPTPNPNVLIEYGYALKSLGYRRIIPVMNTAYGIPDANNLPFNLRHLRHPIQYKCPVESQQVERTGVRDSLTKTLAAATRLILEDPMFLDAIKPPVPAKPHPHDLELLREVRAIFTPPLQTFLVRHHFRTPYRHRILSPLHEMVDDWVGPAHRFHDAQVQVAFGHLLTATTKLVELVGERIFADDRNVEIGTPLTDQDRASEISETTRMGIRALNQAAKELAMELGKFENIARTRLEI